MLFVFTVIGSVFGLAFALGSVNALIAKAMRDALAKRLLEARRRPELAESDRMVVFHLAYMRVSALKRKEWIFNGLKHNQNWLLPKKQLEEQEILLVDPGPWVEAGDWVARRLKNLSLFEPTDNGADSAPKEGETSLESTTESVPACRVLNTISSTEQGEEPKGRFSFVLAWRLAPLAPLAEERFIERLANLLAPGGTLALLVDDPEHLSPIATTAVVKGYIPTPNTAGELVALVRAGGLNDPRVVRERWSEDVEHPLMCIVATAPSSIENQTVR